MFKVNALTFRLRLLRPGGPATHILFSLLSDQLYEILSVSFSLAPSLSLMIIVWANLQEGRPVASGTMSAWQGDFPSLPPDNEDVKRAAYLYIRSDGFIALCKFSCLASLYRQVRAPVPTGINVSIDEPNTAHYPVSLCCLFVDV